MTKTFSELQALATACMDDQSPAVVSYHRNAGDNARRAADPTRCSPGSPAQAWARDAEASALITAATLSHGQQLTTAELLLVAAIIASRGNGEELLAPSELMRAELQGEAELLGWLLDYADAHVSDWNEDEGLDAGSRAEAEEAAERIERGRQLIERVKAAPACSIIPPAPTRVLVALDGGLVQGAVADRPGVSIITVDYDCDGAAADEVFAIPQGDGTTSEGTIGGLSAAFDPAFIDAAEAAELDDPAGAEEHKREQAKLWLASEEATIRRMGEELLAEADQLAAKIAAELQPAAEADAA
jgi:hypothetical protein